MKKILASLLTIAMLATTMSACIIPASAEEVSPYLIDFDFDDYTDTTSDWSEKLTNNFVNLTEVGSNKAYIYTNDATNTASHSIKVAADPTGANNKVLALDWGSASNGKRTTIVFTPNGTTGIKRGSSASGKKLVMESKIFIPTTFGSPEQSIMYNPWDMTATVNATHKTSKANMSSCSIYPISAGQYGSGLARTKFESNVIGGKWVTLKHVVDLSGKAPSKSNALTTTHADTTRGYLDGRMQIDIFGGANNAAGAATTHAVNPNYPAGTGDLQIDHLAAANGNLFASNNGYGNWGTFYGIAFNINAPKDKDKPGKTGVYYIDDVKAYWIDKLEFTAENTDNYQGGKIRLKFNQVIDESVDVNWATVANTTFNAANNKTFGLKDLFAIKTTDGTVVENAITEEGIYTEDGGKTVVIEPQGLTANTDYKIEIDPCFVDEHGQGLKNNSTATQVDLSVGEIKPFTAKLSQTAFKNFAEGREVVVTATLSHEIADATITNGVVVKNDEGATFARNNGWTAVLSDDAKTIEFDFSGLTPDEYTITVNDNFVALNEAKLESVFEITISQQSDYEYLFNDTFDDDSYTAGNWISGTPYTATSDPIYLYNSASYRVQNNKWDIQTQGKKVVTDGFFMGVVPATGLGLGDKFTGNVLKIENTVSTKMNSNYLAYRRNFTDAEGNIYTINLNDEKYAGKKLVYEADIYVANPACGFEPFTPSNTAKQVYDYNATNTDNFILYSDKAGAFRVLLGNNNYTKTLGPAYMWNSAATKDGLFVNAPVNLKVVMDATDDSHDTIKVYINDEIYKTTTHNGLVDHPLANKEVEDFGMSNFIGAAAEYATLYGFWGTVSANTTYVDNFKAYLVDAFEIESVTGASEVFNTDKSVVEYTFTRPVNASTVTDNVVLLNEAGSEVANGIDWDNTKVTDTGYKLTVKLSGDLPNSTRYTIKIKDGLVDEDGYALSKKYMTYTYPFAEKYADSKTTDGTYDVVYEGKTFNCTYNEAAQTISYGSVVLPLQNPVADYVTMKTEVSIVTSEANSVLAKATEAVVANGKVTTTVTITNPESEAKAIWAVVAAYGDYNEMLGCEVVPATEIAAGTEVSEDIEVAITSGTVKSVKLYLWNTYTDMVPYHKAAPIYTYAE